MFVYSDPSREEDIWSLPNVEIFYQANDVETDEGDIMPEGWYWRACFPGCMPDGDPFGPFESYDSAVEDAQSDFF